MALTPLDIYNKEFKKVSFGGLNKVEVDDFLDEVMHELEALLKENAAVKEQIGGLTLKLEHYRSLEDALNRTLVVAQSTADDIKSNARREADLIIQEARLQAERVIEAGHSKSRKLIESHADMLRVVDTLRGQLRSIAREVQRSADSLPKAVELPGAQVDTTAYGALVGYTTAAPAAQQSYREAAPSQHEEPAAHTESDEADFPPARRTPPAWDQD